MKIGTAAWGLRRLSLVQQLELARSMELPLLELSFANVPLDYLQTESTREDCRHVRSLFEQAGVSQQCGCTGNDFTNEYTQDNLDSLNKLRKVIALAAEAGVKQLRIFAGFASDSAIFGARFDAMINCLCQAQDAAGEAGIVLNMETHGGVSPVGTELYHFNSVTTRADMLAEILDRVPGLMLNFDPANLFAAGHPAPQEFFRRFRSRIGCIHLKDFRKAGRGVLPAAVGCGGMDWPALADAIRDFDGPALIEYEIPDNVARGIRTSLDHLRDYHLL